MTNIPYSLASPQMRTGDMIGCRGIKPTQRVIRLIKGGKHDLSHVATVVLSLDDEGTRRVRVCQAEGSGMQFAYLSQVYEASHGELFWIPMRNTLQQQKVIKELATSTVEQELKYDWTATLLAPFRPIIMDIRKLNCSESFLYWQIACGKVAPIYNKKGEQIIEVPGDVPVRLGREMIKLDMGK